MTPLASRIHAEIEAKGPITVARYMEMALTEPGLGYYMTRDPFGAEGDFITAPEISQMFGELIGLWAVVTWGAMGQPAPFILAELGPGRGTLMADALRAAQGQPAFIKAARVRLVEASPHLRARQRDALAAHDPVWCDDVSDLPRGPTILIANEFFDALPVRQFQHADGAWRERRIAIGKDGAFRFITGPEDVHHDGLPARAEDGDIAEIGEAGNRLAAALGKRLASDGGAALIIDYGHAASGIGDTLQAVRGHDYADPLADPGVSDITTHVDFGALAHAARAAGARAWGPVSQGAFLTALGIVRRAEKLAHGKGFDARAVIDAALKRLIAPSEMGNLFKVLAITDSRMAGPAGFEARPA